MAGFGGGRGGGRSGGFGGGRSSGFSRSGSRSHHSSGNRTTIFIGGRRHYGYGSGRQMSGRSALITFGIFMLFFGFMMSAFTPKMEKVEAVITDVERLNDAYGVYYEYEIEYEFDEKLITNTWEDDYYQPVGYKFNIYVDIENPAYFTFDTGVTTTKTIGTVLMFGGGIMLITGIVFCIKKKNDSFDSNTNVEDSWS